MDKKCITCLLSSPKKDSIISNQSLQIFNFKKVIANNDTILQDNQKTITDLEDENHKVNLHLVKAQRNTKIFGAAGVVVGVIGTIFIIK
jgi:hypothetical protein